MEVARARYQAEKAAWPGACFACRDTGDLGGGTPCSCAAGAALRARHAQQAYALQVQELEAGFLTPRTRGFTLDTYPDQRAAALAELRGYLETWDGQTGLLLVGAYGTGKTGLLIGALRAAARRYAGTGRTLRLEVAPSLYNRLRAGYDDRSYTATIGLCQSASLLALDDLGAERPTDWVAEQAYTLVNHRYEHALPIWATSNLELDELTHHIGQRTVWRLAETCLVIHVTGPNWRTAA